MVVLILFSRLTILAAVDNTLVTYRLLRHTGLVLRPQRLGKFTESARST